MKTLNLNVEIKIDEDRIRDLYPDFDILYDSIDDFLEHVRDSIETDSADTLDYLGYSVLIKDELDTSPNLTYYSLN